MNLLTKKNECQKGNKTKDKNMNTTLLNKDKIKTLFPVKQNYLYFNFASDGPLPVPARDAMIAALHETSTEGWMAVSKQIKVYENLRHELSILFSSKKENFAFIKNTSEGVLLALLTMDLQPDENYIVAADAFPTTIRMMQNNCKGSMRKIAINSPIPLVDQLKTVCDKKTRAIVLDWVHFFTGKIIDINGVVEFAQERDIFTVIDGIQGAGALELTLDKSGIDFFVTSAHKWLLAPQGSGFIYVSPKVWKKRERKSLGWLGYDWRDFSDFSIEPELREGAGIMEYGTRSYSAALGLYECLKIFNELNIKKIEKHNETLRLYFLENLLSMDYETIQSPTTKATSIIPFRIPNHEPRELLEFLQEKKVMMSLRNGYIRAAFHLVNDLNEVETLVHLLKR